MVHANKSPSNVFFFVYSAFKHAHIRRHIECVHEKLKQPQCNICQKSFGLRSSLYRHVQSVHANKKPFKCDLCKYSASQHCHLTRHIEWVHGKLKQH
jgi:KRAB domain-containing zinc finger protein